MASYPTESNAVSGGYYMTNLDSIAQYLESNGFSQAAAAGIAGTIAGESGGNPESVGSGGAGLIGNTPPYPGEVTGNAQKDFDSQLNNLIQYADSNSAEAVARGGVNLATLKNATNPTQAASWWSAFEGPLVPGSDIRTNVVNQVYQDLNGYKPSSGYVNTAAGTATLDAATSASGGGSTCLGVNLFGHCFGVSLGSVENTLFSYAERLGLFILGGIFVIMGLYILVKDTGAAQSVKQEATTSAEVAAVA
jgi:hypothetical protein